MMILEVKDLTKTYTGRFGGNQVQALKGVTFTVEAGEYVAIMGESGSGKTTLLNILAALDRPTGGTVLLDGKNPAGLRDDNILLPLVLSGKSVPEMEEKLAAVAEPLGIGDILNKYPYEVSGGQKQRAAAARAMITDPKLILADEPTGALDSQSSSDLLRVFEKMNGNGQTILMVTHSTDAASHANRVLFIRDGVVFHQIYRGGCTNEQLYQKISDTLTMLRKGGEVV